MSFDCIIPIGQTCNISFLLQNAKLKKQTTLFEWFVSPSLRDITNILIKIVNCDDNDILKMKNNQVFIGDEIYSGHYNCDNFKSIYIRRRDRLIDIIKSHKKILFCRAEVHINTYTKEDIDTFINLILTINKDLEDVKILLISQNKLDLEHSNLVNIVYDKQNSDPYCTSKEFNELFTNSLQTIGYNLHDITNMSFSDFSEL